MTSLDMFPQPVIDSILRDHGVTKKDGYTIITKRVGITCQGAIYDRDGNYVFGLQNMFTQKGIRESLEDYVEMLKNGATVLDLERDLVAQKAGW